MHLLALEFLPMELELVLSLPKMLESWFGSAVCCVNELGSCLLFNFVNAPFGCIILVLVCS
jgi:hypothetical protein